MRTHLHGHRISEEMCWMRNAILTLYFHGRRNAMMLRRVQALTELLMYTSSNTRCFVDRATPLLMSLLMLFVMCTNTNCAQTGSS